MKNETPLVTVPSRSSLRFAPVLVIAALMAVCPTLMRADTISTWEFAGQPGNQISTAGTGSANVTAASFVRGAGLTPNVGSNSINAAGWDTAPAANPAMDLDYFSFGFIVAPGFSATLTSLNITTRSSLTGPGSWGLYTSLDGYAAPFTVLNQSGTNFLDSVIDLSGLGSITGSIDFRLIQIGNTAANGGTTGAAGTFRVADYSPDGGATFIPVTLSGTTLPAGVPDAGSTLPLLGFASLGLIALRRKLRC